MRGTKGNREIACGAPRNRVERPVGLLGHLRSYLEHRVGCAAADAHAKCGVKAIVNPSWGWEVWISALKGAGNVAVKAGTAIEARSNI